ncbi:MAG TPA: hypothetical protein PK854_01115 [Oscillospiraceae bacterium]|nr:hypothetical protein [Oscillospiraceae bacterium]HPS33852.1 hypothetical protein [Oscillospiraceae bacterium]
MEKCKLIKPDISYQDDIISFRQEMLEANSSMDGTGPLRHMENIEEWLEFNRKSENPDTVQNELVTAEQFIYVRETDHKIVGMIQFRHYFMIFLKNTAGISVIRFGRMREVKDMQSKCFPIV